MCELHGGYEEIFSDRDNLGGGFDPIEKYESNWIISPGFGVKIKMFETSP